MQTAGFVIDVTQHDFRVCIEDSLQINNSNNNNIYSGSSTHRSVFQGGPVIYIYIIHGKLYYAYLIIYYDYI
jgi:hypothetical protein